MCAPLHGSAPSRGVRHDSESRRQLQESLWNLRILPESFESFLESLESQEISTRIIIIIPSKTLQNIVL